MVCANVAGLLSAFV
jgi:hypothetical protein